MALSDRTSISMIGRDVGVRYLSMRLLRSAGRARALATRTTERESSHEVCRGPSPVPPHKH